jgi:hypothetical protein
MLSSKRIITETLWKLAEAAPITVGKHAIHKLELKLGLDN